MIENTPCEASFNLPKGDTGLHFSDIILNIPKNHQWLNSAASKNVLMAYKGQTKGQFNYFKLNERQKTLTTEMTW